MLNLTETQSNPPRIGRVQAVAVDAPPAQAQRAAHGMALPKDLIRGGEIVLLAIKPSVWRPFFDSAGWVVAAVAASILVIALERPIPGLSAPVTAQLFLMTAAARLLLALTRWVPTWYVLTNLRVLHIQGVRSPRVTSLFLTKVRDTSLSETGAEKMTGLGTVIITAEEEKGHQTMVWRSVNQPLHVHEKIRKAIRDATVQ